MVDFESPQIKEPFYKTPNTMMDFELHQFKESFTTNNLSLQTS